MKYQRVLYTNNLSTELRSKLRIVAYNKRRALKGNVYFVSFASDADVAYADRACQRLRNVTLKPFQARACDQSECDGQLTGSKQKTPTASSSFQAPPSGVTFLPHETGPSALATQNVASLPDRQAPNLVGFTLEASLTCLFTIIKDKQQLIDDVKSCLSAMTVAQLAADDLCRLYSKHFSFRWTGIMCVYSSVKEAVATVTWH